MARGGNSEERAEDDHGGFGQASEAVHRASAHRPPRKSVEARAQRGAAEVFPRRDQPFDVVRSFQVIPSMWSAHFKSSRALPSYRHPTNPLDGVRVKVLGTVKP
jgi:hypothetical protein